METDGPKPRVVVVDDNRGFRIAAESFLRTLADVTFAGAASDGDAGLQLIHHERPDAAIVDIVMPGMDGFELADRLRGRFGAPKIILMSMHVDEAMHSRAHLLGVHAVLPKEDFVGRVPAILRSIQLGRPSAPDGLP